MKHITLKATSVMIMTLLSCAWAQDYSQVLLSDINPNAIDQHLRILGRFHYETQGQAYFTARLNLGESNLRVKGQFFDWQARDGSLVELWGQLAQDSEGIYLQFYNGRQLGDDRSPASLTLLEDQPLSVLLRVKQTGTARQPIYQGVSENTILFWLVDYQGELGLQCLEGILDTRQGRYFLTSIRPCL